MSRRLQVVVEEDEIRAYEDCATAMGLTLSGWVRQTLRMAQREVASGDVDGKLAALRRAIGYSFPTADIDEMIAEIERGYRFPETA